MQTYLVKDQGTDSKGEWVPSGVCFIKKPHVQGIQKEQMNMYRYSSINNCI